MTALTQAQKVVALNYGYPFTNYAPHAKLSWEEVQALLPECGDGLYRFLMIELSEGEECDSIETALDRVRGAEEDLQALRLELEATQDEVG